MDTQRPINLTLPAVLFGLSLIATALILHHGLTAAADRLGSAVRAHSDALSTAVASHGDVLSGHIDQHAATLSKPTLNFAAPVPVEQPVTIQGPRRDGALPVDAGLGKK